MTALASSFSVDDKLAEPKLGVAAAMLAIALPTVLARNIPPSATFVNQAAALLGWSLFMLAWSRSCRSAWPLGRGAAALMAALGLSAVAALASYAFGSLPKSLALGPVASVAAAGLVVWAGVGAGRSRLGAKAFSCVCIALVLAGALGVAIGVIQVLAPEWTGAGSVVAPTALEGRASGNLRQPNHLSSVLLWSLIATLWLCEAGQLPRRIGVALGSAMVLGLALTASRTGIVGVVILAIWGVLDRRLSRGARGFLILSPIAYLLIFGALALTDDSFGGQQHVTSTADSPNSRLNIWSNTLSLIARHPWLGVGFGEFNFAWSLTPFPNRPTAFFDHTHNLPLQLLVELGVPLGLLILALLGYALWRAFAAGRTADADTATMLRCAFMMVLMIGLHSLFEYPLWYAYFMLPAAFIWGLCLGHEPLPAKLLAGDATTAGESARPPLKRPAKNHSFILAGLLMLLVSAGAVVEYLRVASIFDPESDESFPLALRIALGERSWLFAHHAHYAEATTAPHPAQALPSFAYASHFLLDTRLMVAWAKALHESGDDERARHIAQRLREFRNPDSDAFFAPCDQPRQPVTDVPFQCMPPTKSMDYTAFR
ncbi:O-antigen ligase family protein [Piscinibacter sp. XHJ-5]|uniref:PglL family O-oligosaccharyltransferase n=1 Tax=Piscinibacter sp. XHJ-5 TaxID=3037797 RepID=UPI002452EA2C|nr:O-antigen ligase family protein [Piscinibacter sp. XHJ-5]